MTAGEAMKWYRLASKGYTQAARGMISRYTHYRMMAAYGLSESVCRRLLHDKVMSCTKWRSDDLTSPEQREIAGMLLPLVGEKYTSMLMGITSGRMKYIRRQVGVLTHGKRPAEYQTHLHHIIEGHTDE